MNPFLINEPTVISFSGGRTSAYMLYRILEAHQMSLPEEAIVCFANTGKEAEETLQFISDCEKNWGIQIHWLEYISDKPKFKKVNFETASRNGEPFEAMIMDKKMLPNNFMRFCTSELKINAIRRYLKSIDLDIDDNQQLVGIRADEPRRVAKFRANPHPEKKYETVCMPLVPIGVSSKEVGNFWANQTFDLGLPNINGKTMHGNCDLCMLKPKSQVLSLIKEKPERALWWIKQEEEAAKRCHGDGKYFAIDRPSYAQMYKYSFEQDDMFDNNEEGISCFCGD